MDNNNSALAVVQKEPVGSAQLVTDFHPVVVSAASIESKRLELKQNWPETLTDKSAYALAKMSVAYGLDPFLKELVILGGAVYPTVAALHRKANEDLGYDGEELRPCTEEERIAFYHPQKPPEDEGLWICKVHHKLRKFPAVGYGRASKANVKMSTMQIWLPEMAQKRARGRAYRIYFNIGVPTVEEMYEFEDGQKMSVDKRSEIVLATFDQINEITEKVLLKEYLTKEVVLQSEWDKIVSAVQSKSMTFQNADATLTYFLGEKHDGTDGKIFRRLAALAKQQETK